MRILQFGRFLIDQNGGVERHVHDLCLSLSQAGQSVTNLVTWAGAGVHETADGGVTTVACQRLALVNSTALSPALIRQALARHRAQPFDVFHLHFPDPLTHLASLCLPAHVPRVITWHSDIVRQKHWLGLYRPFLQAELRRAHALVAPTPVHFKTSRLIPADYPAEQQHVIPFGIDTNRLTLHASHRRLMGSLRERAGSRPLVFALGRHVYYKGFEVLIEAMRHMDALLYLGGVGPLTPALTAQVQAAGLQDRVILTGAIAESDLAAYFHACDFFVLPSVEPNEALGLVQLEAMSCGKPVICTQLGTGVNDLNIDGVTGLTVPARDAQALAAAMRQLVQDPALRHRLGAQALAHALNLGPSSAMARQHVQLYEQVIRQSRPSTER